MLVDMNPVPQCMVVSSPFSVRLPINRNAPERFSMVGLLQRLSASGERER
jgi:hypothetical protein